jgi:hypothetical protein
MRSFITIFGFAAAALIASSRPVVAIVVICLCLVVYLRPDIPEPKNVGHQPDRGTADSGTTARDRIGPQ